MSEKKPDLNNENNETCQEPIKIVGLMSEANFKDMTRLLTAKGIPTINVPDRGEKTTEPQSENLKFLKELFDKSDSFVQVINPNIFDPQENSSKEKTQNTETQIIDFTEADYNNIANIMGAKIIARTNQEGGVQIENLFANKQLLDELHSTKDSFVENFIANINDNKKKKK